VFEKLDDQNKIRKVGVRGRRGPRGLKFHKVIRLNE
jgi:hypothetical protein